MFGVFKPIFFSQFMTEDFTEQSSVIGLTALLKASYSNGPQAFLQDSFKESVQEALAKLDLSLLPVAVNQVLLYIRTSVVTFNSVFCLL